MPPDSVCFGSFERFFECVEFCWHINPGPQGVPGSVVPHQTRRGKPQPLNWGVAWPDGRLAKTCEMYCHPRILFADRPIWPILGPLGIRAILAIDRIMQACMFSTKNHAGLYSADWPRFWEHQEFATQSPICTSRGCNLIWARWQALSCGNVGEPVDQNFSKVLWKLLKTGRESVLYPWRIHGAAIYGNMDPINIPPMLVYIRVPYMDPMG